MAAHLKVFQDLTISHLMVEAPHRVVLINHQAAKEAMVHLHKVLMCLIADHQADLRVIIHLDQIHQLVPNFPVVNHQGPPALVLTVEVDHRLNLDLNLLAKMGFHLAVALDLKIRTISIKE